MRILRSTSRELAAACNAASSRAISLNCPHRIHLDTVAHRYFLERGTRGGSDFVPVRDVPGGSEPSTPASPSTSCSRASMRRTTPATNRLWIPPPPAPSRPTAWRKASPSTRTARPTRARLNWPTAMASACPCASTPSPRACKSPRCHTHEREASSPAVFP